MHYFFLTIENNRKNTLYKISVERTHLLLYCIKSKKDTVLTNFNTITAELLQICKRNDSNLNRCIQDSINALKQHTRGAYFESFLLLLYIHAHNV